MMLCINVCIYIYIYICALYTSLTRALDLVRALPYETVVNYEQIDLDSCLSFRKQRPKYIRRLTSKPIVVLTTRFCRDIHFLLRLHDSFRSRTIQL